MSFFFFVLKQDRLCLITVSRADDVNPLVKKKKKCRGYGADLCPQINSSHKSQKQISDLSDYRN